MKKLLKSKIKFSWYTSPLLFAVVLTLLLGLINKSAFNPYRIDLRLLPKQRDTYNVFVNVNKDKFKESISFGLYENTNLYYVGINKDKVFLKDDYKVSFSCSHISDIDSDGNKEIFFFSNHQDSLFLNTLNIPKREISYKYVGNRRVAQKNFRVAGFIGESDSNNDGYNEVYFYINGKYKEDVRNIFRYDSYNDKLIRSERYDSVIVNSFVHKDGSDFDIVYSTWGFKKSKDYTNNDTLSYIKAGLYILDKDLKRKIHPILYKGENKAVGCIGISRGNKDYFLTFVDCMKNNKHTHKTLVECFDYSGNKIKSVFIDYDLFILKKGYFTINKGDNSYLYLSLKQGGLLKLNSDLQVLRKIQIDKIKTPILAYKGDIDGDGSKELFFHNNSTKYNVIVKEDFSKPVYFVRPKPFDILERVYVINNLQSNKHNSIGHSYSKVRHENLYLESKYITIYLKYYKAKDYWKTYLYSLIVFFSILFLVWLIRFLVARSLQNKYEVMNRIAELRYQNVSNQMSPHFTMNAMNSIASLIFKEDKEKAYDFLSKLAKLMKMSLLDSSKSTRTLKSEFEFVKAYLDLQKLRFKNKFSYTIEMDSCVADNLLIMPFIVQTFVENAIKHGLKDLEAGGKVSVTTETKSDGVSIFIEDNGIGRKAAALNKRFTESTGKGVSLAKEYIDIMNKKDNRKMSINIEDLYEDNKAAGTRVSIFIDFIDEV